MPPATETLSHERELLGRVKDKIKNLFLQRERGAQSGLFKATYPTSSLADRNLTALWNRVHRSLCTYQLASLVHAPEFGPILWEVCRAFEAGIIPEVNKLGTIDSYFLKDREGKIVALFKPLQTFFSDSLREYVAYRLDHAHFAGVPAVVMTELYHPLWGGRKKGICRLYVEGETVLYKPQGTPPLSAQQVRRIALLDLRLVNPDRHLSNMIYVKEEQRLVPIDHGAILSSAPHLLNFAWLRWPQAHTAFNAEEIRYIAELDSVQEAKLLADLSLERERIVQLLVASAIVKEGASKGYLPVEIAPYVLRSAAEAGKTAPPSLLEETMQKLSQLQTNEWRELFLNAQREVKGKI